MYNRKSTNKLVKNLLEAEVQLTEDINTAMYILDDGQMIDGEFDFGIRGQDHRIIEAGIDYDRYAKDFWTRLHREYRVVRLVPETNVALVKGRQRLTEAQKALLANTNYEIEVY